MGLDLGAVRVHSGAAAETLASGHRAHAFTYGNHVVLGSNAQHAASSARTRVLAHELVHVGQQTPVAASSEAPHRPRARAPPGVQRLADDDSSIVPAFVSDLATSVSDVIPDLDSILDAVRDQVRAIPGYIVLTYVTGTDPLSDEPVPATPLELVEKLLTFGPFGAAVGTVLQAVDVLGEVFAFLKEGLETHGLTLARIEGDIGRAWEELSVTNGIAGNVAIVRRYVDAFLSDLLAFVESIADRVLEVVRAVVARVAEPLLEIDPIGPVWSLAKKVMHYDPLRGENVDAPTAEIIADFLRLIGQEQRLAQMEERGTLQKTADWLDTQFLIFAGLVVDVAMLFSDARAAIQPENLPNLLNDLPALAQRTYGLVLRVADFAATVIVKILELIKTALLGWLSAYAGSIPGFNLLTVIAGVNPFTSEAVPRTAENLIRGFITLMPGGEATYDQLAETGVIADAAARIEEAISALGITPELVVGTFRGIWDTFSLDDLLDPISAFVRVLDLFGEPLSRLIQFVGVVIEVVVTLVLRLMNFPSELLASVISNTMSAITDIRRDPVGFLLNMMEALKAGFTGFFENIATYLLDGLVAWLFRGLGQLGITLPTDFSLGSIFDLIFQVLGLSIEHLWEKLAEHIGAERVRMIRDAIDTLTGVWTFVQDVQREGLSAIWRYIQDQLGAIWQTLLETAMEWVMTQLITSGMMKLLSFLDPTFIMSVVNGCIALFNAVQAAIEYLHDMLEILNLYVGTLAKVAAGNIAPGAEMIEAGLAAAVPVAIGFLAYLLGIDDVPRRIADIVLGIREAVDYAIDWLIEQAVRLGQAVLDALGLGKEEPAQTPAAGGPKKQAEDLLKARLTEPKTPAELQAIVAEIRTQLQPAGLSGLELRGPSADGQYEIAAAASDFERLCAMIPSLGERPRHVIMEVTLEMHDPEVPLEGQPGVGAVKDPVRDESGAIQFDEAGNVVMTTTSLTLPPVIPFGRSKLPRTTSGGVALPPVPGSGRIQLLTYNTSEKPRADNNLTHAERQFEEFFERAPAIANNVREIHADINWSPCSICSGTLSHVSRLTRRATRRTLHWHDLYEHPTRGTTDASLGSITGWEVTPSSVSPPAEGLSEFDAAEWAAMG